MPETRQKAVLNEISDAIYDPGIHRVWSAAHQLVAEKRNYVIFAGRHNLVHSLLIGIVPGNYE